ncbi:hypothetical protein MRX96_028080 [Rhipicephalus microplus]
MSEDKEVKPVHGMFAVPAPPAFDLTERPNGLPGSNYSTTTALPLA